MKRRGAAHDAERMVRDSTGFRSDTGLAEGNPMERLQRALARGYQRQKDPDYVSVSWACQEQAAEFMNSVECDIVRVMDELERIGEPLP